MSAIKEEQAKIEKQEKKIEKFKDYPLDHQIKRALGELGFNSPLEVQAITMPLIFEGKDLIVKSQTGSGKTAAFAIPICEKIDVELERPQVLVLTPTRELAVQVKEDMVDIGKYKGLKFCALYGKQPMELQRKELKQNPHVIVATPGRMMDHILNKNVKLQSIKYLVIDEADEMLLMGFKTQLEAIINKLPLERVTLLFSATIPEEVHDLSQMYMISPQYIEVESEVTNIEKIEQIYYAVDGLKKVDFMKKMIKHEQPEKTLIFCNTQQQVDALFDIARKWDRSTCAVHGGMDQSVRMEKLRAFKKGAYKTLIATDLAARGLHVRGITHIINYGVPFDHENYVHRIGRTGRVDEVGIAITLVIPSEMERFKALEDFLGYKIPCKGGHVEKKPKENPEKKNAKNRYKEGPKKGADVKIQINAGVNNSNLKRSDILASIRSISGVTSDDIGKIDMRETTTNVAILNGKERLIIKAFESKKIKGKMYRAKRG
ncbi:DEAD/DEAH box helicase [Fusibacter sp. 3D3]|uniref:DEAD/DEAH box helicase n=1 Tax=Fusibacter sp. 3D3 TaxID=1048380 RepID=UPI0008584C53|nr:DEAD/DEAH box helicase [Fusibacter sp. 3D3]GAU76680.1 ATP-dependent RNA helicase YxiN [Fusibacter sp. 3D3]